MKIGIPKEIKPQEGRVALTPQDCRILIDSGHSLWVQSQAGVASGYADRDYQQQGAQIAQTAAKLFDAAQLIVKVKEPIEGDLALLRADHTLFCYLHLAPNPALTRRLLDIGLTAVAFETVEEQNRLPLLQPMSEVAGRIAVQVGAHLLHQSSGGRGILLGGVTGTDAGHVTVLGAGVAGTQSALLASALGANVTVLDRSETALEKLQKRDARIQGKIFDVVDVDALLEQTDLLVGAVLVKGARAPRLIRRTQIARMPQGSVVADISVDQGGCIETTRPTSYDAPTYVDSGVIHFCVSNMPGAVPRTSTQAISAVLPPYIERLTRPNWFDEDVVMRQATNLRHGEILLDALRDIDN